MLEWAFGGDFEMSASLFKELLVSGLQGWSFCKGKNLMLLNIILDGYC